MSQFLSFEAYVIHISKPILTIGVQKTTRSKHTFVKILKSKVNNLE
jgi:hypothetical protein